MNTTWKLPTQGLVGNASAVASEKYPGIITPGFSIADFIRLGPSVTHNDTNLDFNVEVKYNDNIIEISSFYIPVNTMFPNGDIQAYTNGGEVITSESDISEKPFVYAKLISGSTWHSAIWDGTITFTGGPDINNELLIQWLNDNATFMG